MATPVVAFNIRYEKVDPRRELFQAVVESQAVLLELKRPKHHLKKRLDVLPRRPNIVEHRNEYNLLHCSA